jgi:hypothetical protein
MIPLRFSIPLFLATCFLAIAPARAEQYDRRDFETVLVPVAARDLPGAGGSLWRTTLYVHHESEPITVIGYDNHDALSPLPGQTYRAPLFLSSPGDTAGTLLFVHKAIAGSTHYDLRIRDVSRDSAGPGVAVPVIREQELLTSPAYLLAVPCDARFRRMLRIYSPLVETSTSFLVKVTDDLRNTVIYTAHWQLITSGKTVSVPGMTVPRQPAERDVSLDQFVPNLTSYTTVTVTVQPDDPSERFWSFVSVTDNVTQQVALVLPH